MKLRDIKIGSFLKVIMAVDVLALVIISVLFISMTNSMQEVIRMKDIQIEYSNIAQSVSDASDYLTNEARLYVQTGDKEHHDNYLKEVNETKTREHAIERLVEMNTPQELLDTLSKATQESTNLAKIEDEAMNALEAGDTDAARERMFDKNYSDYKNRISGFISEFDSNLSKYAEESVKKSASTAKFTENLTLAGLVFLIVVITSSLIYIVMKIKKLVNIKEEMDVLASNEGDLTKRMPSESNDEIGNIADSFNLFTGKVHDIVKEVHENSVNISYLCSELNENVQKSTESSEEISKVVEEIAKGATEQAKETQDSSEHVIDMGKALEHSLQLTDLLRQLASDIETKKDEGTKLLDILINKTDNSSNDSKEIDSIVSQTNEYAMEIEKASQMIQSIADQTNLLALNAAIEAARAGDAGKGFAVVADNIRTLAEQSIGFAQEINSVIIALKERSQKAVETAKTLDAGIKEQTEGVYDTQNKFIDIANSLDNMKNLVEELQSSSAILEQRKIDLVDMVQNLSAIAQENAASTQETTATIQQQASSLHMIADESDKLNDSVNNVLKVINKFKF